MARVLALAVVPNRPALAEALRVLIVCGCALALVLAGRPLPF